MSSVAPALLTMARETRGKTQSTLAKEVGISQGKLSKYEAGLIPVSDSDLDSLSKSLFYTPELFQLSDQVCGFGSAHFYHRKRADLTVGTLKIVQARMNLFRFQSRRLLDGVAIKCRDLPDMDVDVFGGASKVATEVRRAWQIPDGPIHNLASIVEKAGLVVRTMDFGTKRLDAVAHVVDGFQPIVFANSCSPMDRLRFTLAHELGHALMHRRPSNNVEAEADEFAAEFLMPRREVIGDLRRLQLDRLPALKTYWKVSMAALIKRAFDLEQITERHYRTLFTQLSINGWRTKEPIDVEPEKPLLLDSILRVQSETNGLTLDQLASRVYLARTDEFRSEFMRDVRVGLRIVG